MSEEPRSPLTAVLGDMSATRRSVIASLAAVLGVFAGRGRSLAANLVPKLGVNQIGVNPGAVAFQLNQRARIVRPDDFLYFEVEYDNIGPVGSPPTELKRLDAGNPARLIVHHQPQAIAEQAYQETAPSDNTGAPLGPEPTNIPPSVAQARLAGESRVAFVMPQAASIPYSLRGLLDAFETWPMSLDINAQPAPLDFTLLTTLPLFELNTGPAVNPQVKGTPSLKTAPNLNAQPRKLTAREFFEIYRRFPKPGEDTSAPAAGAFNQPPTTLKVVPIAIKPTAPHEPAKNVTAIELPYRLIQSPLETRRLEPRSRPCRPQRPH